MNKKPSCVLYAPVPGYSGYSSKSRDIAKALIELYKDEWDIKIIPCGWGSLPTNFIENNPDWKWIEDYYLLEPLNYKPNIMIYCTIPTETGFKGDYTVLFTAGIETTVCAPQWIEALNQLDLIIVPSEHSKNVFENTTFNKTDQNNQVIGEIKLQKPVIVIHEGFDEEIYKHLPKIEESSPIKQELDQIKEGFNFLFAGAWLPGEFNEDRKNISGLIKVFLETFKNKKQKPGLILKTHIGSASLMDKEEILRRIQSIKNTVNSKDLPNIYLFHGDITDQEMNELYNHPKVKAMVCLTKGEGYGRPLLEFTQSKKPIICSGWSGQLDFLNPEFTTLLPGALTPIHPSAQVKDILIEGSHWFSVDLGQAGGYMKDYFENFDKYKDNGKRLGFYCKTNFSYIKMKEKMKKELDDRVILPYTIKMPELRLVK